MKNCVFCVFYVINNPSARRVPQWHKYLSFLMRKISERFYPVLQGFNTRQVSNDVFAKSQPTITLYSRAIDVPLVATCESILRPVGFEIQHLIPRPHLHHNNILGRKMSSFIYIFSLCSTALLCQYAANITLVHPGIVCALIILVVYIFATHERILFAVSPFQLLLLSRD